MAAGQQVKYELEIGSHSAEDFLVLAFEWEEEISRPFTAEITAVVDKSVEIQPDALIAQKAVFTLHLGDETRYLHGVVASVKNSFTLTYDGVPRRVFRLRVVPTLWTLSQVRSCRIFQGLSVPDIVKKVLSDADVDLRSALSATYAARDYCVQYNESDLDFVCRLLEDEGIFFFFEHGQDKDTVVLADANNACTAVPGSDSIVYLPPGAAMDTDHFDAFSTRLEVKTSAVTLRDFDYSRPTVNLTALASGKDAKLEVYEFPGGYQQLAVGKKLAKIRLEEQQAQTQVFEGSSIARNLSPGFTFELNQFPISEFDQKYLLVAVSHRGYRPGTPGVQAAAVDGKQEVYRNEVRAIQASVPFRPPRRTPQAIIPGPQTAVVVGPAGEEIYTDSQARIKVQFHWDREGKNDQNSSCWVRVSQAWAGAGWGALYLPRIGHEVVVEFVEGDPDSPLVTGSVYNGLNPSPVSLPSDKTKSTLRSATTPGSNGFNELLFDDAKGQEQLFLHAQKDLNIVVLNDKTEQVGNNETIQIGTDRSLKIGGNQSLQVGGDDSSTITGNESLTVGANRTTAIGGNDTETIGGNQTTSVGKAYALSVAVASVETIGAAKSLNVGGAYNVAVGGAMNEVVGGVKAEQVGGAMTETVGGQKTETIGGDRTRTVGGDLSDQIAGKRTLTVSKDLSISVGGNLTTKVTNSYSLKANDITLSAQEKFILTVGSASLEIDQNGDVTIKGGQISVTADGNLVLKGSKISEN